MNDKQKPSIRFKGFTEAWEQRKLTEFVEFFSGLTYTPDDVQKNGTLVLRSSNVSNGEVVDADNVYVNPQVVNSENVKVGDIVVVVRNGSRSLIGKHAQIKAIMPNAVIGAFMTGIRSECPAFTNALLNTSRFEKEIAMNMGATINQITGYMFSKMEFKVPCLDEQKKIGEYFEKLDNLITLHQRKYDKLVNVKKSMLEKMFPRDGKNVPEIRFSGFTEAWEQRKVQEVADFIDGNYGEKYPRDNEFVEKGIPFFTSAVTGSEGLFNEKNVKYITIEKNNELLKAQSRGGDLILTNRGASMGIIAEIPEKYGLVNIGPQLTRIRGRNKISYNKFLLCLFQTSFYNRKLTSMNAGSAMSFIGLKGLGDIDILLPQYDEQIQIGQYFSQLDNLITLHQREVEKLQNIKKSCLEKMFV